MAHAALTLSALGARLVEPIDALRNRLAARRTPQGGWPGKLILQPEPLAIGDFGRGEALIDGHLMLAGQPMEIARTHPWQLQARSPQFTEALHGFEWLDDFAANGTRPAREAAQEWTLQWVRRHARGTGLGWRPQLAGRRLLRWVMHGRFLTRRLSADEKEQILQSMGHHIAYLEARWPFETTGLPRFEAVCGLIFGALAAEGMDAYLSSGLRALTRCCEDQIGEDGGLPNRNPEELTDVGALLVATMKALEAADRPVDPVHMIAIHRIVPTLRHLRMADGGLARFNAGGPGAPGRLDMTLALSGVRDRSPHPRPMGYARLSGGRVTVVMDADRPPRGPASIAAHASTLAFEMTSGRRPVIVNCGSGAWFGADWLRAGRSTASHSTLVLDRTSSSRVSRPGFVTRVFGEMLLDAPTQVPFDQTSDHTGSWFRASHDGYLMTHGLVHERSIFLGALGHEIHGEDVIFAPDEPARARFRKKMDGAVKLGTQTALHFHLHPDVTLRHTNDEGTLQLELKSGEVWTFAQKGADMRIEESAYLDTRNAQPIASQQIVLGLHVREDVQTINWSIWREGSSGNSIRDLVVDDTTGT